MYCKYCGKQISDDSVFCQYCGKNIDSNNCPQIEVSAEKEKKPNVNTTTNGIIQDKPKVVNTTPLSHIFDGFHPKINNKITFTPTPELLDFYNKEEISTENSTNTPPKNISKREKVLWLKQLNVEQRAAVKEEKSCLLTAIVFAICLIPGLIYCFQQSFIFSYDKIGPYAGLFIFIGIGIVLTIIVANIHHNYWLEYNNIIEDANNEIKKILESGEGKPDDLFRLKKQYIERKLNNNKPLTDEEFEWHTSRYCWACGKKHSEPPVPYIYRVSEEKTWKEGVYRKYRTYRTEATILLCPACKKELSEFNTRGSGLIPRTKWNFSYIPQIYRWYQKLKEISHYDLINDHQKPM